LAIIAYFWISTSYLTNVRLLHSGELSAPGTVSLPFTYTKDVILVDASVNGVEGRFLLDTAAFDSKVEHSFAELAGLNTVTTKRVTTAQGLEDRLPVTQIADFSLAEARFERTSAGILTYPAQSPTACVAPQGLIGANLMRRGHWKIDYQNQQLTLSEEPIPVPGSATTLEFSHPVMSATPTISLTLGGREVSGVLFDTGFNGGLVLPRSLADQFSGQPTMELLDQSTSGIFGTNKDTLIVKELLLELGTSSATIPVEFSSLDKALLGNDVLEHFDVYIDYAKDEIALVPVSEVEVDPPRRFLPGITANDEWVVDRTEVNSNLSLGQTIPTINGLRPSDVFEDYCDYFLNIDRILSQLPLAPE